MTYHRIVDGVSESLTRRRNFLEQMFHVCCHETRSRTFFLLNIISSALMLSILSFPFHDYVTNITSQTPRFFRRLEKHMLQPAKQFHKKQSNLFWELPESISDIWQEIISLFFKDSTDRAKSNGFWKLHTHARNFFVRVCACRPLEIYPGLEGLRTCYLLMM